MYFSVDNHDVFRVTLMINTAKVVGIFLYFQKGSNDDTLNIFMKIFTGKTCKLRKRNGSDVLVDCPSAIDEIPGILSGEGYTVNTTQVADGEYRIRAEK